MSQITTHILDTSLGQPAADVSVVLYAWQDSTWTEIGTGKTNSDGRVSGLLSEDKKLNSGKYRLNFLTAPYFERHDSESFYPYVDIVFQIKGDGQHYHVPLLLNPFGYSTYRGS